MLVELKSKIETFENEIRAGRAAAVARELTKINSRRIPRGLRLKLSNLCRRTGLFHAGLRFLMPVVRNETATQAELAEYGMLLLRSDLMLEAWKTLDRVDVKQAPEALLFKAFHHFREWREPEAIPLLEEYLRFPLEPYQGVVGKLNLAAAFVGSDESERAKSLLSEITDISREKNYGRILGNCHELRAQMEIKRGDISKARLAIEESSRELSQMQTADELYMRKWKAVLESLETGKTESLVKFRAEALRRREWESVREADRQRLKISFDEELLASLMFGTPHPRYRSLVSTELGRNVGGEVLVMGLGPCLDLRTGLFGGRSVFKVGSHIHRVFLTLVRDFYRPSRLGTLFTDLYGGDHFDVASSPDRVHQVLRRTRRLIESEHLPLSIVEVKGDFSLRMEGAISIAVPYDKADWPDSKVQVERLRSIFGFTRSFDAPSARSALGLSRTSFQRLVSKALAENQLVKIGTRNATRYALRAA